VSAGKREPRLFTIADIEREFELQSYWFGEKWCPAVDRRETGYSIRVVRSITRTRGGESTTYDYFELDAEGLITTAPRGYSKDYKPGRVVDVDAAVARFAVPQPDAARIGGAW